MNDILDAFLEGDELEEDVQQARNTLRLLQQHIIEHKLSKLLINPLDYEISFQNTTLKWTIKPSVFKILTKLFGIGEGTIEQAIAETTFTINLTHQFDGSVSFFVELTGHPEQRIHTGSLIDKVNEADTHFNFGATFRF